MDSYHPDQTQIADPTNPARNSALGFSFIGEPMTIEPEPTKAERLAAALLADQQERTQRTVNHNIIACFSCGYTFVYRGRQGELNGRFCSMRCQDWYDAGNPSYEQQREHERKLLNVPLADLVVVAGPPGMVGRKPFDELFDAAARAMGVQRETYQMKRTREGYIIPCAHCRKDFDSKGLRFCSKECETGSRQRADNLAVLAEAGIETKAKKLCETCQGRMPIWRNGRKVQSGTRFCSDKCRVKAARTRKAA
jgi:predicted nucleic acid-binding Zn ribbon protein